MLTAHSIFVVFVRAGVVWTNSGEPCGRPGVGLWPLADARLADTRLWRVPGWRMLGVHAIVMDFGISDHAEKRLSQVLTLVGILTVVYGLWLTWAIIH